MTISVADIDARLSYSLNDEDRVRWTLPERCAWISDAAKEIVNLRPAAGAITLTLDLVAGARQAIPAECSLLLDVVRNIKADDSPGRTVKRTDRDLLDTQDPDWYGRTKASAVKHYTYDDRNPREFYAYPPVIEGAKVEALCAQPPASVSAIEDDLALNSTYIGPVVSYVLWRALTKDSEYASGAIAGQHLQAFMAAMGVKNQNALVSGPKGALNEKP